MAGYDAFISYSHSADGRLAPALQRATEHLSRPWYAWRSGLKLFRDQTDLALAPKLERIIQDALAQSQWLLLLASPDAARSPWVAKELEWWLDNRSADRLLIVRSAGTIEWDDARNDFDRALSDAVPPVLFGRLAAEPLYAELPAAGDAERADPRSQAVRTAAIQIAARLLGRPPAEVESEDLAQVRRNRVWAGAAGVLIAIGAVLASGMWWLAERRAAQLRAEGVRSRVGELVVNAEAAARGGAHELGLALALQALATDPQSEEARRQGIAALARTPATHVLRGHEGAVVAVAFGPGGLLTGGADGKARLWDPLSGKLLVTFAGHDASITDLAFSRDGTHIVTCGDDRRALVSDARDGRLLRRLEGHQATVMRAEILPGNGQLVTVSADQTARLWSLAGGQELSRVMLASGGNDVRITDDGRFAVIALANAVPQVWDLATRTLRPLVAHRGRVEAVRVLPGRQQAVTFGNDGDLWLWDLAQARPLRRLTGPAESMHTGEVSPDGKRLVSFGAEREVLGWELATGTATPPMRGSPARLETMHYAPLGDLVGATSREDWAYVWHVPSGRLLAALAGHQGELTSIALAGTSDAPVVATGSRDGTARLWHVFQGELQRRFVAPGGAKLEQVHFSADGRRVVGWTGKGAELSWPLDRPEAPPQRRDVGSDTSLVVVSVDEQRVFRVRDDEQGALVSADGGETLLAAGPLSGAEGTGVFSGDGSRLATLSDERIRIWRTDDSSLQAEFKAQGLLVQYVALDRQGRRAVSCSNDDGPAELWDVDAKRRIAELSKPGVSCIPVFSDDGRTVMLLAEDGSALWWDGMTGAPRQTQRGHRGALRGGEFSPDGRLALTWGVDRIVRIWDLEARRALSVLAGHGESVSRARFGAGGAIVLSASADGSARLWDTRSGTLLAVLDANLGPLTDVQLSPDRRLALTLTRSGVAALWNVSLVTRSAGEVLAAMRERLGRLGTRLTAEQCQLYFASPIGRRPDECQSKETSP